MISSLILFKSVLKTLTTFFWLLLQLARFPALHVSCIAFHTAQFGLFNSTSVLEDTSTISCQSLKLVLKTSSLVLVCIQCVPNSSYSFSAWFLAAFFSFSCFSRDMIFLCFFIQLLLYKLS